MVTRTAVMGSFLGLAALLAVGAGASPAGDFSFDFRQEGGLYTFDGGFQADTAPEGAWEVLTDYDNVSRFVANMNCRVVRREGDEVLVDQTVGGGFLFIRHEVKGLLRVKETFPRTICLEEVSQRHFDLYQAVWSIEGPAGGGPVRVTYRLEARRGPATPGFVTADLFRQAAQDLVIGMKKEMDRREQERRKNALVHPLIPGGG